ncbi:peptide/nickel transport system substrate-binding protein [Kribbella orskensis]|uniref:Peptide/nickel transport system substrate-binding protein n=1 Tax=Kribbella orskensis TaxID=2512216 RepID=A0ABY2B6Y8_9ACTN|nr:MULTISPECIES: ABC transporter substrate-binding protein [Kribbella]TCN28796.1 peptide/nickel transport system substrate-binding protein [Kribbella sp. VKM Ac-2500]TCO08636.1 peptide/nickel transport system substrate-binding protein [Kribbella orskensis]
MKSYPTRAVALLATAGLLVVTACSAGSSTSSGSSPSADQSLSIGLVAEPASLDFTTTDGAAIPQALLGNVYNGLVKQDETGKIVPDLAKSWTVSPDRKTYAFTLVDNAKFTNGAAFTAADAVFSINQVKTKWTTSLKAAMDVVQNAKADSPTKLTVTLAKPSNDWLFRMTTRIGAMFSQTGVDKLATDPVGTGPYKLGSWKRGDSIVLQRNDAYWGTKPFFNQVTLKYFKDPTALNNALLTGTINVVGTVQAPEALSQFTSNDKYQVIEGTTNGEVLLSFNNSRPVFKDVRVRQAIRQAIDHKALLDTCFAGRGKLVGSMVPPTDPWYEDLTSVAPYDLAKAKSFLQAAGATGASLRLRLPTLPYATSCGQVVKSQLEQAGLKVTIDQLEFPAAWLTTVFKNADYDMSIIAHVEPRDLGAVFNAKYYTRYDDPTLQALLASADAGDEATQVADLKKAARRLSEQAAGDWLFLLPNLMVAEKDITGLPQNAITESFDLSRLARS